MTAQDITELIGKTPLIKLNRITGTNTEVYAKLEYFNPGGSVKDRIAKAMIEDAEGKGLLDKNTVIIEPTSGNTGIGLAMIAAAKGYRMILTMPDSMSIERQKLLKLFGAEIVLTPAAEGMNGAIKKAEELAVEFPKSFIPMQFSNPANPEAHRTSTALEIWEDMNGNVDIFIAGIGTGGTITGTGEILKQKNPGLKVIAVEPENSPVLSGGKAGSHRIQGIGAGFIPDVLNTNLIDEIIKVLDEDAVKYCKLAASEEGILCGISSGAAIRAAVEIASRPKNKGKKIVVLIPDTGERYLSSLEV
ncbi:MAG: cysteine synthase A [Chlorobi bacterium]|nr:cysteine synthase A [Chlorobiota bacterium]